MIGDVIDVALVAVLVYLAIVWMREARAHLALAGIGILGCVYFAARQLGLGLTAWIFQGFFAAFLILIVVLFHTELRQAFERLALLGMRRDRGVRSAPGVIEKLVGVAAQLAQKRRGALIVLPGRDPLERHLQGGILLGGDVSEPLLLSLFDPHSPGHDGAVVIAGERVERFAVHLPLSTAHEQLEMRGTRHAAALGLSENADALCIVVSEETGSISTAVDGVLRQLESPAALAGVVRRFLMDRFGPTTQTRMDLMRGFRADWRTAVASVGAAAVLWLVVIPGSELAEETLEVPVVVTNLPEGYTLDRVEPPQVEAVLTGLRRDFFWVDRADLRVEIDALLVQLGRRTFRVSPELVLHPAGLTVKSVAPEKLRLHVSTRSDEPS